MLPPVAAPEDETRSQRRWQLQPDRCRLYRDRSKKAESHGALGGHSHPRWAFREHKNVRKVTTTRCAAYLRSCGSSLENCVTVRGAMEPPSRIEHANGHRAKPGKHARTVGPSPTAPSSGTTHGLSPQTIAV